MRKKLLVVSIIILLAVGGVGLYLNSDLASVISVIDIGDDINQPNPTAEITRPAAYKEYSLVATVNGQTALELLKATTEVELKQYDFGAMISAINGLVASDSYYWAFYLNDEYAKQAADKTVLDAGDKVEFKYEKIEVFPLE